MESHGLEPETFSVCSDKDARNDESGLFQFYTKSINYINIG
jgi:hypothetical protein